jgi:DNA-directed RNA polymerase beta subunit
MNKYVLLVNSGQNVKEGTVLATTSSLKSGKLAIGKNLVVAEMGYNGKNYEDGWAVSTEMTKKYTNYYLQKITIKVPENVKIQEMELTKGKTTKAGDLLMSFIKSKYVENAIETDDDLNDEDDDTMYGLEQHGANSKYYSPGGVIEEIVVRLNSNKVDQKLKLLHQESIKDLNKLLGSCELLAKNHPGTKQEKEEIYQECMGNTDNISSLKIGGHKINGEEPGWAIIEVYIKRENNIGNGSKFTLGNSGGKGTVQYIIPEGKTPVTMETHMQVDFFATSLSIVKRKNTDIYFNMYLGKCIYFLNEMLKELNKKGTPVPKMKDFVLSAIKFIDKTEEKIIVKEYEQFFTQNSPEQVKKWINASHSLNRPLIVGIKPPFMNRITMRDIVELARYLHVPLKEKIMIPENDDTFTMRKVPVGILNVYFLEHFPQMQGSMRGSQYVKNSIITGQGSAGAKDRKGATKTGLYDLYSLLSKTPYNLIKELHTLKSDARQAKHAYQRQIFQTGELPSIKDIKITRVDTTTKNYIETLLLGAGLKSWY